VSLLRPFELHRPATVEEACALLAALGDDAVPYAGGTELLLLMKEGLLRPRHLVDLKRIPGLDAIHDGDGRVALGATATHRTVERARLVHERVPIVASVARHVANVRVRNVGTVGGNLAFADPHSDLATLFLALDAAVDLASPRGRRTLALDELVRGPWETARAADELLTGVTLVPPPRVAAAYVKFGMHERPTLGIAVVLHLAGPAGAGGDEGGFCEPGDPTPGGGGSQNPPSSPPTLATLTRVVDARIAVGCVNPKPARAHDAEARLRGCDVAALEDVVSDVASLAAASADPADDIHGSADYKREMVAVFTRRALRIAAARAGRGARDARGAAVVAVPSYPYTVVA
jgi:carbon-monoxide dehydrogenase medium subunit